MGNVTFDTVNSLPDFLTDERFEIQFSKMPSVSGITADEINLRTVTFTPPKKTIEHIDFTLHTHKKHQPTKNTPDDTLTITMVETVDAKTLQFIKDWRERCAETNTNKVSSADEREAEILCYHKDNQERTVWAYKIKHVTLQSYNLPDFSDGSSPAVVSPSITIKMGDFLDGPTV